MIEQGCTVCICLRRLCLACLAPDRYTITYSPTSVVSFVGCCKGVSRYWNGSKRYSPNLPNWIGYLWRHFSKFSRNTQDTRLASLFAMAKIQRNGHDHQAPFLVWPRFVELAMTIRHLFRLLTYQTVTQGKTNYHMANISQTPNIFTDLDPLLND